MSFEKADASAPGHTSVESFVFINSPIKNLWAAILTCVEHRAGPARRQRGSHSHSSKRRDAEETPHT